MTWTLMKRMIGVLPLAGWLLFSAGCEFDGGGWGANDSFKAEFHQSYPLKAGGKVSLENFNGGVEVMAWEKDEVEAHATRYARTQEQLDRIKIDAAVSADAVRIRTIRPEGASWNGNGGVRYVLRVPKRVDLERIASTNGGVSVTGTTGRANLRSTNGTIKASMVEGAVRAETTNGNVEMNGVRGGVIANTTNGSVRGERLRGGFEAETTNGSIRVTLDEAAEGRPVRARSTNGAIEITASRLQGNDIRCETSNGGITLRLPADLKANLRARTSHASITSEFDVARSGRVDKHRLEGPIQGGGPLIELSTSNGGIKVLRN